ncbi:dynamin family protein [Longirhabdus pacifica]|uniref:dynamin family protein n=1 Tax=Longirhabdus pacifica TaxID=2305227 RepID=UPI001008DB19|nr:dynamin family protein [Longirhabdus pacifica]
MSEILLEQSKKQNEHQHQDSNDNLKDNLHAIAIKMKLAEDDEHAAKVNQLIEKWEQKELYIAFCGHFSAGKSSLINQLCGKPLLPSSPIPTSANVVSIRSGQTAQASMTYVDTDVVKQVDVQQLDEHCLDGDISSITIQYPLAGLDEHTVLLDTPGVDSTDERHQLATESALHVADVIFFVMDYNHVLSEQNFSFAKRLLDDGKIVFFIINQIDKHVSEELSMQDFAQQIEEAYANWGVVSYGNIFLSSKYPQHERSQWKAFMQLVHTLQQQKNVLIQHNSQVSVDKIISEHGEKRMQQFAKQREAMVSPLSGSVEEIEARWDTLQQQKQRIMEQEDQSLMELKNKAMDVIKNANIIPAQTRELMHRFLESQQSNFKMGLIFSAAKTEKEKKARLQMLHQHMVDHVQIQIEKHLYSIFQSEFTLPLDPAWFIEQQQPGAVWSNQYSMNYAQHCSEQMKKMYRTYVNEQLALVTKEKKRQATEEAQQVALEIAQSQTEMDIIANIRHIEQEQAQHIQSLRSLVPSVSDVAVMQHMWEHLMHHDNDHHDHHDHHNHHNHQNLLGSDDNIEQMSAEQTEKHHQTASDHDEQKEQLHASIKQESIHPEMEWKAELTESASKLEAAAQIIEPFSALAPLRTIMTEKAKQFRNNQFTIALFGAFSAGKSSFANAWIGLDVLPVSPHPMTASTIKIMPPTFECPHETARIKMKSEDVLLQDMMYALASLGYTVTSITECLNVIEQLDAKEISAKGRGHFAFLQAVGKGWNDHQHQLGETLQGDKAVFHQFAAEEEDAAFVAHIEWYLDCPATRMGIVLVDTPGADSINARHTDVAFNYIKNADAIIFITYYNHAFSRADRAFLQQLGRVKDHFALDKMFFVINAIDLASSQEEVQLVIDHVKNNLSTFQIVQPHIFPISSMQALRAKREGDDQLYYQSRMPILEQHLAAFSLQERKQMSTVSLQNYIRSAIHHIDGWISELEQGEVEREARMQHLQEVAEVQKEKLHGISFEAQRKQIENEMQELLYYVKQRVKFQFHDQFNAAFHPSSLSREGKQMTQSMLQCWNELVHDVSHFVSQELLATSLRIERFCKPLLTQKLEQWEDETKEKLTGYTFSQNELTAWPTPEVKQHVEPPSLSVQQLMKYFKNGKYFFEQEGKKKLEDVLANEWEVAVQHHVSQHQTMFSSFYEEEMNKQLDKWKTDGANSIHHYVIGIQQTFQQNMSVTTLEEAKQQLNKIKA